MYPRANPFIGLSQNETHTNICLRCHNPWQPVIYILQKVNLIGRECPRLLLTLSNSRQSFQSLDEQRVCATSLSPAFSPFCLGMCEWTDCPGGHLPQNEVVLQLIIAFSVHLSAVFLGV